MHPPHKPWTTNPDRRVESAAVYSLHPTPLRNTSSVRYLVIAYSHVNHAKKYLLKKVTLPLTQLERTRATQSKET